jgi:hypothetical protein
VPPAKYRNNEAGDQGDHLEAHHDPVPDWRGVSMRNSNRRVLKQVQNPAYRIRTVRRDFPLGKAMPQFAVAIDAQIDRDDAGDDFIQEELHPNIRASLADPMTRPHDLSSGKVTAVIALGDTWFGVAGFGVGSIAGMIAATVWSPRSCDPGWGKSRLTTVSAKSAPGRYVGFRHKRTFSRSGCH